MAYEEIDPELYMKVMKEFYDRITEFEEKLFKNVEEGRKIEEKLYKNYLKMMKKGEKLIENVKENLDLKRKIKKNMYRKI